MMTEEVIDQSATEVEANPQATDEVQVEEGSEQQQAAGEQEVIDEEYEEVDYEGTKYKVPKPLKDALMLHKDYTQKRQADAESRRTWEQQKAAEEQGIQRQRQHIQDYAQLHALDMQLSQYKDVDWNKIVDSDPVDAMKLDRQYRTLQEMRQGIAGRIQQVEAQEAFEKQQELAKRIEQGHETLKREIPNWSEETRNAIKDYATNAGFTAHEVASIIDPRQVKMLHKAYLYDQMMKKAATTPKAEVKPITKVSSRREGQDKDPDKMTTEEFMKWRNRQLKAAR